MLTFYILFDKMPLNHSWNKCDKQLQTNEARRHAATIQWTSPPKRTPSTGNGFCFILGNIYNKNTKQTHLKQHLYLYKPILFSNHVLAINSRPKRQHSKRWEPYKHLSDLLSSAWNARTSLSPANKMWRVPTGR